MKTKKIKWIPVLWMVVFFFVTACSGGGSDSSSGGGDGVNSSDPVVDDSGTDSGDNDDGVNSSDPVVDDSGTDVISINGRIFSANGYFLIPQDGDRVEWQEYDTLEYINLDYGVSVAEFTEYLWWSGFETINSVDTLVGYRSTEGFDGTVNAINYVAYIDNEFRTYKGDYNLDSSIPSHFSYDPYIAVPIDLMPGDTFSSTYTEYISDGIEFAVVLMTITDVAYDGVTTHFDTYDDCIRYTTEYDVTYYSNEHYDSETVEWFCKGVGWVRSEITNYGEYGTIEILDINSIFD